MRQNLKTFPPCYSQSALLADFTPQLWFPWAWDFYSLDLRFRKEKNQIENHTHFDFQKSIQINEENLICSWRAFCRKPKPKVETSSSNLRNLKIMPINLNEIVLSWIRPLDIFHWFLLERDTFFKYASHELKYWHWFPFTNFDLSRKIYFLSVSYLNFNVYEKRFVEVKVKYVETVYDWAFDLP